MLLSGEDHPQFLQTRHLSDSEVVLIEEKGHTSYCDNCLKDGVTCSKLTVFAISTGGTVEIVTKIVLMD